MNSTHLRVLVSCVLLAGLGTGAILFVPVSYMSRVPLLFALIAFLLYVEARLVFGWLRVALLARPMQRHVCPQPHTCPFPHIVAPPVPPPAPRPAVVYPIIPVPAPPLPDPPRPMPLPFAALAAPRRTDGRIKREGERRYDP